jgi:hypothetical protein
MNKKQVVICAILVLMVFTLGARAATMNPVEVRVGNTVIQVFPLVVSSKAAEAPPGVLYIFSSTATTDGSAGGRNTIGDICPTEDTGSHFCSLHEIETAWTSNGLHFSDPFPMSWVDNPNLLGTLYPDSNGDPKDSLWASIGPYGNCASWTHNVSGAFGTAVGSSGVNISSMDCVNSLPVACCKQMP